MSVQLSYLSEFWTAFLQQLKELAPGGRNLKEEILSALDYGPLFVVKLFGFQIRVSEAVVSMLFAILVTLLFALFFLRNLSLKPGKAQTLAELFFGAIDNSCRASGLSREQARQVVPFVASVGLLITISNLSELFVIKPAAVNPSFPLTLALLDLVYVIGMGIRMVGLKGFIGSLMQPTSVLLPFKLLDYVIKPVSLAFRLFGNIFGAFILMTFIEVLVPLALPGVLGLWFQLGDGVVQGLVFAYLTINYLGEIVEGAEASKLAAEEKLKKRQLKASG